MALYPCPQPLREQLEEAEEGLRSATVTRGRKRGCWRGDLVERPLPSCPDREEDEGDKSTRERETHGRWTEGLPPPLVPSRAVLGGGAGRLRKSITNKRKPQDRMVHRGYVNN